MNHGKKTSTTPQTQTMQDITMPQKTKNKIGVSETKVRSSTHTFTTREVIKLWVNEGDDVALSQTWINPLEVRAAFKQYLKDVKAGDPQAARKFRKHLQ